MQLFLVLVIFIILHVCWQFSDTEFVVALLLYRLFSLQAAHIRYKINEHACMHSDAELIMRGETIITQLTARITISGELNKV